MNSEKIKNFLPIGTVVILKNAKKRVMITGFCIVPKEDNTKIYDYTGVLYPEGVINSEQCLMFNHNQIEKVFHMGLVDEEEKEFKKTLGQVIEKEKTGNESKQSETANSSSTEIRISE